MAYLGERREGGVAHALGGRIGRHQFGMLGLQAFEFAKQPVVFSVGNAGFVEHVVTVIVQVKFGTQFEDTGGGSHDRFSLEAKEQPWLLSG